MQIGVEDFLPVYPRQDASTIQAKIFHDKEFYELKLDPEERVPDKPGTYLKHQKIIQRLLSPHTNIRALLLFHGLGTGKCVLPNTLIYTAVGRIKASVLWAKYEDIDTITHDSVGVWCKPRHSILTMSYDENEEKVVNGEVINMYRQWVDEQVVTIELYDGRHITITQEHKLLCYDYSSSSPSSSKRGLWTNDFQEGDTIHTLRNSTINGSLNNLEDTVKRNEEEFYSRIRYIHLARYKGWVYDFEVNEYHNYYANGILCHNTCASIAVAENYKSIRDFDRRALILVKGYSQSLLNNFRNEIAKKCTDGTYLPEFAPNAHTRELRIRRLVNESYELKTVGGFVKELLSYGDSFERRVKKEYSNRVIIIDEAQDLRIHSSKSKKKGEEDSKTTYETIHRFLHTVDHPTILLLSATPMWDRTNEIATIMNLILPKNKQLPTGKKFDSEYLKKGVLANRKKFIGMVKGRVSYVRPTQTNATIVDMGKKNKFLEHTKVWEDTMSDFQAKTLREAEKRVKVETVKRKKGDTVEEVERRIVGGTFKEFSRQASNFVFPNGTYGKEGYDTYVNKDGVISVDAKLIRDELDRFSSKFHSIVRIILERPNELHFVYTEFVKNGGANLFAAVLNLYGYSKANGRESTESKRYALITSTSGSEQQFNRVKDLFNSEKNYGGKYVQVFIGSRKIGLGITLKRVQNIHILSPHWNSPTIEQAIGRALRLDSHEDMPPETEVRIYRHVAVEKNLNVLTSDIEIYKLAEEKDVSDRSVYRALKESSIDCPLTYARNVLPKDKDGSQICDYVQCNYECSDVPSTGKKNGVNTYTSSDLSTVSYNAYYSEKEVNDIVEKIIVLFRTAFYMKTEDIFNRLKQYEPQLVLKAILKTISERKLITDRYGFPSYLKEDKDIVFLDRGVNVPQKFIEAYYVENPLVVESVDLSNYVEFEGLSRDTNILNKTCYGSVEQLVEGLTFPSKIVLLEYAYRLVRTQPKTSTLYKKAKQIIDKFKNELYVTNKGTAHSMVIDRFKGSSHTVAREKAVTGKMRCYDEEKEEWRYCTELEELEIKKLTKKSEADLLKDNPYGMYATLSKKDQKFRVVTQAKEGGRAMTGMVCGTGKLSKKRIIGLLIELEFTPPNEDMKAYEGMDEVRLRGMLSRSKIDEVVKDLNDVDLEELKRRMTFINTKIEKLCSWLQNWFESKNLLVEM